MKTVIRKARRDYKCYDCGRLILKDDEYREVTLYPQDEPHLSDKPITEKFCKNH
jgi:hypothetical protein